MGDNLFDNCNSKAEIMAKIFELSKIGEIDCGIINESAAKRFLEINCVDKSTQFYLLASQQFNSRTYMQAAEVMQEVSKENNNAAIMMLSMASEIKCAGSIIKDSVGILAMAIKDSKEITRMFHYDNGKS